MTRTRISKVCEWKSRTSTSLLDVSLNGRGKVGAGELLLLGLLAGNDGDSEELLVHTAILIQAKVDLREKVKGRG